MSNKQTVVLVHQGDEIHRRPFLNALVGYWVEIHTETGEHMIDVRCLSKDGIHGKSDNGEDSDLLLFRWDEIEYLNYP